MQNAPRRYQTGYLEPTTQDWVFGLPDESSAADIGYYDVEMEIWALGEPDVLSGGWMPNARLAGFRASRAPDSAD